MEILRDLKSRQATAIYSYAILNAQGINILDTDSSNIGIDESEHPYFHQLTDAARLTSSGSASYRSPIIFENDRSVIIFSSVINDLSGKMIGVLRAKYDALIFGTLFSRTKGMVGRGSFAVLLDENNLRLVHGRRNDLKYTLASEISEQKLQLL